MAQLSIKVSDRTYRLECDDAEKDRLRELADYFCSKVETLRKQSGNAGQDRLLVMAALMIADELWDAKELSESTSVAGQSSKASVGDMAASARLTRKLEEAAAKIKDLAGQINDSAGTKN